MSSRIFRVNFTLQQAGQAGDVPHICLPLFFFYFIGKKSNRLTALLRCYRNFHSLLVSWLISAGRQNHKFFNVIILVQSLWYLEQKVIRCIGSGKSGPKDQVALHYYYTSPSHWCATHEVSKFISQFRSHYQPARWWHQPVYSVPPSAGQLLPLCICQCTHTIEFFTYDIWIY